MIKIFDYIYYRLNKFYYKWDGKNGSTSAIGLSMIQAMTIVSIFIMILRIFFTKIQMQNFTQHIIWGCTLIFIFFVILNTIIYKNKYFHLDEYWKKETIQQKRIHGFLVILALVFPWVLFFLIGFVNSHY